MKVLLRQAICSFAVAALLASAGNAARADCLSGAGETAGGTCAPADLTQADAALNATAAQLNAVLPPARRVKLRAEQARFLRHRLRACRQHGGAALDENCAVRLTRARLAALQAQAAAPVTPAAQNGHYAVPGTSMPWLWVNGGLNAAYPFGQQDGTGPIVLALAGLNAGPGQRLIIRYVSGAVSAGAHWPAGDADGVASPYDNGNSPPGGAIFPSKYMQPYPIHLGALVGAFADTMGLLASAPFALGDGPDLKLIPPGATQLQLGVNDDSAADSTGSLVISVIAAPEGNIAGAARGLHGCAVFGGAVGPVCQNYPAWTSGYWLPPPGSGALRVLAVGGGGGGGLADPATGVGGAGGGSGKVITGTMPIPDGAMRIVVGQGGAGARSATVPSMGGTGSVIGGLVARGGWGGQPGGGGSADGPGGNSGGGGGGGGTYQASYDAGAGGMGGSGGDGSAGLPPTDLLAGFNGSAGGAGTAFPDFEYGGLSFGPGPGGAGGGFGAGGVTEAGVSCAGGGGGGGGGGGLLINNAGPRAGSDSGPELLKLCGAPALSGQGGLGYGAGGGGAGAGIAGPAGSGANGVVFVAW